MRSGPDYIVRIEGLATHNQQDAAASGDSPKGRPWISVQWECCSAYSRIYRNRAGTAYEGRCPKCASLVKATIGPGGTDNRTFTAG